MATRKSKNTWLFSLKLLSAWTSKCKRVCYFLKSVKEDTCIPSNTKFLSWNAILSVVKEGTYLFLMIHFVNPSVNTWNNTFATDIKKNIYTFAF
jgi:hypothetical protein